MNIKFILSEKITVNKSRNRLDAFLKKHANNSDLILDLGSKGRPYKKYFPNAVAIDIEKTPSLNAVADAHSLPFKEAAFEMLVCSEVLEHLPKPWIAISEMQRVLKKNGQLILSTRFIFPIHGSPGDFFRYTRFGLKSLFSGWEIVSLEEEATGLDAFGLLFHRLAFESLTHPKFLRYIFFIVGSIFQKMDPFLIGGRSIYCTGYYLVAKKK